MSLLGPRVFRKPPPAFVKCRGGRRSDPTKIAYQDWLYFRFDKGASWRPYLWIPSSHAKLYVTLAPPPPPW